MHVIGARRTERIEAFYASRRAWLVHTLRPILGDEAEDVAQDAMLELFRRWEYISAAISAGGVAAKDRVRAGVRRRTRNIDRPRLERRRALLEAQLQSSRTQRPRS